MWLQRSHVRPFWPSTIKPISICPPARTGGRPRCRVYISASTTTASRPELITQNSELRTGVSLARLPHHEERDADDREPQQPANHLHLLADGLVLVRQRGRVGHAFEHFERFVSVPALDENRCRERDDEPDDRRYQPRRHVVLVGQLVVSDEQAAENEHQH